MPYSHLTATDLEVALGNMFAASQASRRPSAVIVDVLGRYSVEWTSHWDCQRWPYRMSFFSSDKAATSTDMTCYSSTELRTVVTSAAEKAGCPLTRIDCYDRSIMVGRHTVTGEFTPNLRPYRRLVNDLFDPEINVDYDELLFDVPLPEAPIAISEFFQRFSHPWNTLIAQVRSISSTSDPDVVTGVLQPMLAHGLERLEATTQRGLGVGHSLTAVAYIPAPVEHRT